MAYVAFCLALLRAPLPPAFMPESIVAERFFADIESLSGKAVKRVEPAIDSLPIVCKVRDKKRQDVKFLILLLKAHGIYVHLVRKEDGTEEFFASRNPAPPPRPFTPRSFVFYSPKHLPPEKLLEKIRESLPAEVKAVLDPRTGKIILSGKCKEKVKEAERILKANDIKPPRKRIYHLYRCVGMFVKDAHKELLKRLPRSVRRRILILPYRKTNTLLIACGTDDWKLVLSLLREINPEGEIPGKESAD